MHYNVEPIVRRRQGYNGYFQPLLFTKIKSPQDPNQNEELEPDPHSYQNALDKHM